MATKRLGRVQFSLELETALNAAGAKFFALMMPETRREIGDGTAIAVFEHRLFEGVEDGTRVDDVPLYNVLFRHRGRSEPLAIHAYKVERA